jgi:hypothetical protein
MLQQRVSFEDATTPRIDVVAAATNSFFAMLREFYTKTARRQTFFFGDDSDSDDDMGDASLGIGKCYFHIWLDDIGNHMVKIIQQGDPGNALCFMGQVVKVAFAQGSLWTGAEEYGDEPDYESWEHDMVTWSVEVLRKVTTAAETFLKNTPIMKKWWLFSLQQLLSVMRHSDPTTAKKNE